MLTYDTPSPTFLRIAEDESYTFSDYSRLGFHVSEAVQFHGYTLETRNLDLPILAVSAESIERLQSHIRAVRPFIHLTNETARREFLIAPIVSELVRISRVRVRTEYSLYVSKSLRGTLDYLLDSTHKKVVVMEAKLADMESGFTQLAVELIAIDKSQQFEQSTILGAVSIGDVWQFGVLARAEKRLLQDLNFYTIPKDLGEVLGILSAELSA